MLSLSELIATLEREDPEQVLPFGFAHPHSYRGYYECLAFEPAWNVKVGDMLRDAARSLGSTFYGWKGGEFKMLADTDCYLAYEGECGEELGKTLLGFMLGRVPVKESPDGE